MDEAATQEVATEEQLAEIIDDVEWVLKCMDENTHLCERCQHLKGQSTPELKTSPVLKICAEARLAKQGTHA